MGREMKQMVTRKTRERPLARMGVSVGAERKEMTWAQARDAD